MRCAKPAIFASTALLAICIIMLAATVVAWASTEHSLGGWVEAVEVSGSGDATSTGPAIAADGQNDLHLMWMGGADPLELNAVTVTHSYDGGGSWPASHRLDTGLGAYLADMGVEVSGTLHVVWAEPFYGNQRLWHAQLVSDNWQPKKMITETSTQRGIQAPTLAVADGRVHAIWSEKPGVLERDLYYSRRDGSVWSDPTLAADTGATSDFPSICADQYGNLHLVWQENTSPTSHIMYISGTVGTGETSWSTTPITVSEGLAAHATTPDIVVGGDDTVHIVFGGDIAGQAQYQNVYYVGFPMSNTGQISPTVIPDSGVRVAHSLPKWALPSVALNTDDQVHVVWNGEQEGDSSDRIYYSMRPGKGAPWSRPVAVSLDQGLPDGFPVIAADGTFVHVAWQMHTPGTDRDIYYTRRLPAVGYFPLVFKNYP